MEITSFLGPFLRALFFLTEDLPAKPLGVFIRLRVLELSGLERGRIALILSPQRSQFSFPLLATVLLRTHLPNFGQGLFVYM